MAAPTLIQLLGESSTISDDQTDEIVISIPEIDDALDENNTTAQRLFVALLERFESIQDTDLQSQVTVASAPFSQEVIDGNPATRYRYTVDVNVPGSFSLLSID